MKYVEGAKSKGHGEKQLRSRLHLSLVRLGLSSTCYHLYYCAHMLHATCYMLDRPFLSAYAQLMGDCMMNTK